MASTKASIRGAGGLEVAPGVSLIASGHLPDPHIPISTSHVKALEVLRDSDVCWTYLVLPRMSCPSR